jgi:hypothetical protein
MANSEQVHTEKTVRDYHNSERKYAILQETSGEENESWIYFIKYSGNEEALDHLSKQLDEVEFYIIDDLSTFDLETKCLVSEQTAKEMTQVDLNYFSFHRKFDGTLKKINLGLKSRYDNEKKIEKVFKVLGYGKIEKYIDQEDVDPEDLEETLELPDSSESNSSTDEHSEEHSSDESSDESSSSEEDEKTNVKKSNTTEKKKRGNIPKVLQELPRFAKAKAHRKK